jgi:hypothetical protein
MNMLGIMMIRVTIMTPLAPSPSLSLSRSPRWQAYGEALSIEERASGRGYRYAQTLSNWAGLLAGQAGREDEAIAKFGEALDLSRKALGGDHPNVARGLNCIARVLRQQVKGLRWRGGVAVGCIVQSC